MKCHDGNARVGICRNLYTRCKRQYQFNEIQGIDIQIISTVNPIIHVHSIKGLHDALALEEQRPVGSKVMA